MEVMVTCPYRWQVLSFHRAFLMNFCPYSGREDTGRWHDINPKQHRVLCLTFGKSEVDITCLFPKHIIIYGSRRFMTNNHTQVLAFQGFFFIYSFPTKVSLADYSMQMGPSLKIFRQSRPSLWFMEFLRDNRIIFHRIHANSTYIYH